MKSIIVILILFSSKLAFGQIINGNFENWDTTYNAAYSAELSSDFGVPNPFGGIAKHWISSSPFGICQTTDSYSGKYSIIIHNWYTYVNEWIKYHNSINGRPRYLQGNYKYLSGGKNGLSHGNAIVTLTRFNGTSNDTIANGKYQFDSMNIYTDFQISLNYISGFQPDSITIYILNANKNCNSNNICNLLFLDNLTLTDTPLSSNNFTTTDNHLIVHPNPFDERVSIQSSIPIRYIQILDLTGKALLFFEYNAEGYLDLKSLPEGLYFLKLDFDHKQSIIKKLIKI